MKIAVPPHHFCDDFLLLHHRLLVFATTWATWIRRLRRPVVISSARKQQKSHLLESLFSLTTKMSKEEEETRKLLRSKDSLRRCLHQGKLSASLFLQSLADGLVPRGRMCRSRTAQQPSDEDEEGERRYYDKSSSEIANCSSSTEPSTAPRK